MHQEGIEIGFAYFPYVFKMFMFVDGVARNVYT